MARVSMWVIVTYIHISIRWPLGHVRRQKKIVPHRRKIVPRKRLAITGVCIVVRRQKKRSYPEIHTPHQPHLAVPYNSGMIDNFHVNISVVPLPFIPSLFWFDWFNNHAKWPFLRSTKTCQDVAGRGYDFGGMIFFLLHSWSRTCTIEKKSYPQNHILITCCGVRFYG